MKICLVHNEYGTFSGEEAVVASQVKLLEEHGHQVCRFTRSSVEIERMMLGQLRAFCSGIYNPFSARAFRRFLVDQRPDLVHIHNLYPLISPAVLHVCKEFSLPVVMTLHNYRLICPNGLFMVGGKICEKCRGGKEYWCIFRKCEGSLLKSLGYALRNFAARVRKDYLHNVHVFAALTYFQRQKLVSEGYPAERVMVMPNMSQPAGETGTEDLGNYIGYVGRVSPEKGVDTLLEAADKHPQIPFQVAGGYDKYPELIARASGNFHFLGHLARNSVDNFIAQSRIIVMCSICYEGFPAVLVEAMLRGRPVIASRLGGIPEVVDEGVTGLLFEAGNAVDLAAKIQYLWAHPDLCRQMGEAGRKKALLEYTPDTYYRRLMDVYRQAEKICRG
jgi:glycosyltransferase involved in cell wall biosynthesis